MDTPKARILGCSREGYFADPCERPSLTQSMARVLLRQSPLHAWTRHPRLGGKERKRTRSLDDGSVINDLVLGVTERLAIIDAPDFRTKAAQAERDAALEAGKLPIVREKYDEKALVAEAIRARFADAGFLIDASCAEVAIEWEEEGAHGPVLCRGQLDQLFLDRGAWWDVKTIGGEQGAHPENCARHMYTYGYDIQAAAYTSAVTKLRPDLAGRVQGTFLFSELDAPHAVTHAVAGGEYRELGERRWRKAVLLWERCLREDDWPGYDRETHILQPSPAALAALAELEAA